MGLDRSSSFLGARSPATTPHLTSVPASVRPPTVRPFDPRCRQQQKEVGPQEKEEVATTSVWKISWG